MLVAKVKLFFQEAVREIKAKVDFVSLVSRYLKLEKKGKNYQALCPFHEDKKPSLSLSPEKGIYKCFSCGASGDLFKFVQEFEKISFREVVEKLAQELGIEIISREKQEEKEEEKEEEKKEKKERELLFQINREAELYFQRELESPAHRSALDYLQKERKLSKETIKEFSLGYSPGLENRLLETILNFLKRKVEQEKLSKEFLEEDFLLSTGLFTLREYKNPSGQKLRTKFFDRIIFPIKDQSNQLTVGFGGRVLQEKDAAPKYLNSPETKIFQKREQLFALGSSKAKIKKEGTVLLLEGYFDVVQAHQHKLNYAVACLGTALSKEQANLLYRSNYNKNIILGFDSDQAGLKALQAAIEIFLDSELFKVRPDLFVLDLEQNKDLDQLLTSQNQVNSLDFSLDYYKKDALKFLIQKESQNFPEKNSSSLKKVKELLALISKLTDTLEKELYLEECAKFFYFDKQTLLKALQEIESTNFSSNSFYSQRIYSQRATQKKFLSSKSKLEKRKLSNYRELSSLREKNIQLKTEKEILAFLLRLEELAQKKSKELHERIEQVKFSLPELERLKNEILSSWSQENKTSLEKATFFKERMPTNITLIEEVFQLKEKLEALNSEERAFWLLKKKLVQRAAYHKYGSISRRAIISAKVIS